MMGPSVAPYTFLIPQFSPISSSLKLEVLWLDSCQFQGGAELQKNMTSWLRLTEQAPIQI